MSRFGEGDKLAEDRDQRIVAEYQDEFMTMDAIAIKEGLSKERVRQILFKNGVDVKKVREKRSTLQEVERQTQIENLSKLILERSKSLADQGASRGQTLEVLHHLLPDENRDVISDSLGYLIKTQGVIFDRASGAKLVSDNLLRSSVLFAYGHTNRVFSPTEETKSVLNYELIIETADYLNTGSVGEEEICRVLNIISGAIEIVESGNAGSFSASAYDQARETYLNTHPELRKLNVPWPVGSLTILKRFGGSWNNAMAWLGFDINSAPDGFGAPQYTAEEYERAIGDFLSSKCGNTIAEYDVWAKSQRDAGAPRPAAASIRNAYGDWNAAIRNNAADQVSRATERADTKSVPDSLMGELIEAQEKELERIVILEQDAIARDNLTPNTREYLADQKAVASATLNRYKQEEARWIEQTKRWDDQDKASHRQFKVNLWLAIAVGLGSTVSPLVVWALEYLLE